MSKIRALVAGLFLVVTAPACGAAQEPIRAPGPGALPLPPALNGKATVLSPTDASFGTADVADAVKPAGQGGLTQALVVRVTADVPVWRMWSGPTKKDAQGNTNRIGQWWSYDPPRGTQPAYRQDYEICVAWNDLTWVAKCTLRKGAIVAIGPGNSVSAATCGDATGKEAYPVDDKDWQVWIAKAWTRLGPEKDLDCPAESADYAADPADIAKADASSKGAGKSR